MGGGVRLIGAGLAVAAVAVGSAWSALEVAPRADVPRWLALLGVSAVGLTSAALAARRLPRRHLEFVIVAGAVVLRAGALAAPASLSDDVHRYAWDGSLLAQGHDPYAARPVEVVGLGRGLDAAHLARLNSPRYYTVYPPLAQAVFATAALVDGERALRAIFAALDVAGVWALLGLLGRLRRAPGWALLYAWNPLVYWEVAAGGHTEAIMVPLLVLATRDAVDGKAERAGALLGLAASAKLTALVALPLFVVHLASRRGLGRALGAGLLALAVLAIGFAPFAGDTLLPHLRESLSLFGGRFSFNAPIYYALRDAMGYAEGYTAPVDWLVMPALAAATLSWLALMTFVQNGDRERFVGALAFSFLGLMLLSRVIHPWYLLPALALGAAVRSPSVLVASALLPVSYLRYHPFDREEPWLMALEFVPLFVVLGLEGAIRIGVLSPRRERAPSPPPPVG